MAASLLQRVVLPGVPASGAVTTPTLTTVLSAGQGATPFTV